MSELFNLRKTSRKNELFLQFQIAHWLVWKVCWENKKNARNAKSLMKATKKSQFMFLSNCSSSSFLSLLVSLIKGKWKILGKRRRCKETKKRKKMRRRNESMLLEGKLIDAKSCLTFLSFILLFYIASLFLTHPIPALLSSLFQFVCSFRQF